MFYRQYYFIIITLFASLNKSYAESEIYTISSYLQENDTKVKLSNSDIYWVSNEIQTNEADNVEVQLYYESLCRDCIEFYKQHFNPAVQKLSQYVNFRTYPYGNAETINENGVIHFECQHGPPECYGNKLHACAIDNMQNTTAAFLFNSCMMGGVGRGSNDAAADRCAKSLGVDANPIKNCAKGDKGNKLLEYYGEESKKANFSFVPYILINGKMNDGDNFLKDICAAFAVTPPPCVEFS